MSKKVINKLLKRDSAIKRRVTRSNAIKPKFLRILRGAKIEKGVVVWKLSHHEKTGLLFFEASDLTTVKQQVNFVKYIQDQNM